MIVELIFQKNILKKSVLVIIKKKTKEQLKN